jgi:hypothetical protein
VVGSKGAAFNFVDNVIVILHTFGVQVVQATVGLVLHVGPEVRQFTVVKGGEGESLGGKVDLGILSDVVASPINHK